MKPFPGVGNPRNDTCLSVAYMQVLPLRKYGALHQPKQGLATIAIFHTDMSLTFELKRQPCSTLYMDLKRAIHLAWHLQGPCMGQLEPGLF